MTLQQLNVPVKFISIIFCQSSLGYSHDLTVGPAIPALLTSISTLSTLSKVNLKPDETLSKFEISILIFIVLSMF